jgi:hypothetical protein
MNFVTINRAGSKIITGFYYINIQIGKIKLKRYMIDGSPENKTS